MNKLEDIVPKIKRNLKKFKKPGVISVRPGYRMKKSWPTERKAIVALTARSAKAPNLPSQVEGVPVEARTATELEQFSHDHPEQFSRLADHRAELRGTSLLPEFSPDTESLKPTIAPKVAADHHKKIEVPYPPGPGVPLSPVPGKIQITCHVSPDAGWPVLRDFVSGTKKHLKVGMYDFTSKHILDLFDSALSTKEVQLTLDDPPANPSEDQLDPETVASLKNAVKHFESAWALVRSSPETDSWTFPTAYHIKVMVRDSNSVWLSSGNLNNSNQPEMDPFGNPQASDQATAKTSDRDWHVVIESPELAKTFEACLDYDFKLASLHAANRAPVLKNPKHPLKRPSMSGEFDFAKPMTITEQMTITPLLTPDTGDYQSAILDLINKVDKALYIQLQYIHPTNDVTKAKFTELIDAVAAKIDAGKDVRIILSEFQKLKGGLEALQAAGINLANVKIQNNLHNKGFIFDHTKVVISSMNWSGEGVLENRDAGVIIDNATAAAYYEKVFLDDWLTHASQT